jgi:hypothetical protein
MTKIRSKPLSAAISRGKSSEIRALPAGYGVLWVNVREMPAVCGVFRDNVRVVRQDRGDGMGMAGLSGDYYFSGGG